MPDAHLNFAATVVATAPSPATSGTSLVVASGDGDLFPAVPFNCTIWPVGVQPTVANAEIVRVTNIATDTLTITRAQESSSARTIVVGDQIAATITAKTLTDVETDLANHVADGSAAHAATAVSFAPAGTIAATTVQAAIEEVATEAGAGGGAPTDATYLVGASNGDLSAEIVVGATPGGELGGTWASPTVDATHSGSTHAAIQSAAEATAASALSTHVADETNIHGITDTGDIVLTDDARLTDARAPTGAAGGSLTGTYPNPTLAVDMATQAELDAHVSDTSSVHGITDTTAVVLTGDARLSDSRAPNGSAGGVLSGTYPNPGFASDLATQAELDAHVNDASAAHAATAVAFTPAGTIGATTVQAAIEEVATEAAVETAVVIQWFGDLPGTLVNGAVFRVPDIAGSAATFDLNTAFFRLETAGSTTTTVVVEKSAPGGAFSASTITTLTLVAADNEDTDTTSLGTVDSGDLVRIRWTALGTGAATYLVQLEGEAQ